MHTRKQTAWNTIQKIQLVWLLERLQGKQQLMTRELTIVFRCSCHYVRKAITIELMQSRSTVPKRTWNSFQVAFDFDMIL